MDDVSLYVQMIDYIHSNELSMSAMRLTLRARCNFVSHMNGFLTRWSAETRHLDFFVDDENQIAIGEGEENNYHTTLLTSIDVFTGKTNVFLFASVETRWQ